MKAVEKMAKLTVNLSERSYDIVVGHGALTEIGNWAAGLLNGRQVLVVADENSAGYFGANSLASLEKAGKAFKTILDILGILEKEWKKTEAYDDKDYNDLMNVILAVRQSARKAKQYQLADEIRDKLGEIGIVIEDTPTGARWKKRGV